MPKKLAQIASHQSYSFLIGANPQQPSNRHSRAGGNPVSSILARDELCGCRVDPRFREDDEASPDTMPTHRLRS